MPTDKIDADSPSHYWSLVAEPRLSAIERRILSSIGTDPQVYTILDDELAALDTVKRAILTCRNRLSPISRLPPEVLAHIFSFSVEDDPTGWPDYQERPGESLGWIWVTHVCRHWRQVALDNPRLWTDIVFQLGADCTWEMIARAKQAPLGVVSYPIHDDSQQSTLLAVIESHLFHTKFFTAFRDEFDPHIVQALESTAAPILEELTLVSGVIINVPEILFANDAPRLRRAVFVNIQAPWPSPILRNLTSLRLSRWAFPSETEFLDALSNMPLLEDLTINDALPAFSSTLSSNERMQAIPLPRLSNLELNGLWLDVIGVLGAIQFPTSTNLSLTFQSRDAINKPIDGLLPIIQRHTDKLEGFPPKAILLKYLYHGEGLVISTEGLDSQCPPPPTLHLVFDSNRSFSKGVQIMQPILRNICTQELLMLSLEFDSEIICSWDPMYVLEIFDVAPNLKTMQLDFSFYFLSQFFTALGPEPVIAKAGGKFLHDDHDTLRVPFPSLHVLYLNFILSQHNVGPSLPPEELLARALTYRSKRNPPLTVQSINGDGDTPNWFIQRRPKS